MSIPRVHTIIKFGARSDLERLRNTGEVFLNTWGYFKHLESNKIQGDKHEGLTSIHQVANGIQLHIEVDGKFVPIQGIYGQIKFGVSASLLDNINLFCVHAVTDDSFQNLDDQRLKEFGDTALVMTDGDEFLARLRAKLNLEGFPHDSDLVKYVDIESHEGEMGPFRKLASYSYQSELRIIVHAKRNGPLKLWLGDISDISFLFSMAELKSRLRLDTE